MNQETKNNGTAKKTTKQKKHATTCKDNKQQKSFCLLFRSLYRGLIFGDGAGLDNMGFAIEGSWRGESSLAKSHVFEVDPGKLIWIGGIPHPVTVTNEGL